MNQLAKKTVSIIITVAFITGCAGRTPNPVAVNQYGERDRSFTLLKANWLLIDAEVSRLLPASDKTAKNVALGIAGWFLLVPWFFMDFSQAEQTEINALRQRHNHLVILVGEKDCETQKTVAQEVVKKSQGPATKDMNQSNF